MKERGRRMGADRSKDGTRKDGCNLMGKQEERAATHTDNHGFQYVGVLPAWTTVEIRPDDTAEVHGR